MSKPSVQQRAVRCCCLVGIALVLAFATTPRAEGQVLYGSIVGEVKDASGGVIPGATVIIANKGTNLTRQGITDDAGRFNFTDLPAGLYSVKISQPGFKTFEQTEVTVSINNVSRVDASLEVGGVGETITVGAEPPKLQTETSEVAVGVVANGPAESARCSGEELSTGLPDAARLYPASEFALDPDQSVPLAGIHGQRNERQPEQHAH